jgi:hypothetical protein
MKKSKILLGVMAFAAFCGMDATAQISYQNGDLLAGFRSGSSPDVIVDLGSISLYQQTGSASFNVNSNLPGALTSTLGNISGVIWSVFGVNDTTLGSMALTGQSDAYTVWSSKKRNNAGIQSSAPFGDANSAAQGLAAVDIEAIGGNTSPGGASPGLIVNIAPGIVSLDQSVTSYSPDMGGAFNGNFEGNYSYSIERTGSGVMDLYEVNPDSQGKYLGDFSLDSLGDLTFNPVPEPSTWAMLGTGLLTLIAIRRSRNKYL